MLSMSRASFHELYRARGGALGDVLAPARALAQNGPRMTGDRRAHPRFPLILAVQYADAESILDYTEDLSATGLFIRTDRDFAVGDRVSLVVSFPQLLDPVEIQVEVVRRRPATRESPAGVAVRVPPERADHRAVLADVARRIGAQRGLAPAVRVLLVEDNALVASVYAAALRRLSESGGSPPLGVEVAEDGFAAYDRLLRPPKIDVLVTDLFMPVLSGITLVEKIRSEPALGGLPIVVITSGGERERERLAPLGVTLFLRKPVSYQDVAGAIGTLVARVRSGTDQAP
jgi:uncharacterized protein (TIGR02266 family)